MKYWLCVVVAVLMALPIVSQAQPLDEEPPPEAIEEPEQEAPEAHFPLMALSEEEIDAELQIGMNDKDERQGLVIHDATRGWMNALSAANETAGSGFWVQIYTPHAWLRQLGCDAAREYREITARDLEPDDLAAVLRVVAHPDTPDRITKKGMVYTSSVNHVVVRPRDNDKVKPIQPLTKDPFNEDASNAFGATVDLEGITATFDLAELADVRRVNKKLEFEVIVIGSGHREKVFGVKTKHFKDLPGL